MTWTQASKRTREAQRLGRISVIFLLVAAVTTQFLFASPAVRAAPQPPWYTWSLYMSSVDPNADYNLGYSQGLHDYRDLPGNQDSAVILDFGQPGYDARYGYGTFDFAYGYPFVSLSDIATAAEAFGQGYINGVQTEVGSRVTIIIGTNNYQNLATYRDHGQAWAQMVQQVGLHP